MSTRPAIIALAAFLFLAAPAIVNAQDSPGLPPPSA